MARIDITSGSAFQPEPTDGQVITTVRQGSAVESLARRVSMSSRITKVRKYLESDVDIVPEAAVIPESDPTLDEVALELVKFSNRFRISEEDLNDSLPGILDQFKQGWAASFARKLDNAALGVTVAADTTADVSPYNSVYYEANAVGRVTATGGAATFEDIANGLASLEAGNYFDPTRLVIIAHPEFAAEIRNLKDEAGNRVAVEPLAGEVGRIFGYNLVYSRGARTSAAATANPTGNPLLVMGNADHLILGQGVGPTGIESAVSADPGWTTDERELKMTARRAFTVADVTAFTVLEKTAAA